MTHRPAGCRPARARASLPQNRPNTVGPEPDTIACSAPVSTNTAQAIFPWLAATSSGVDLVYYGAPSTSNQTWSVYFAQNVAGSWGTPQQLMAVHKGSVCESGATCTTGRQLFDDLGVDTDLNGWAHITFSQDSHTMG